MIPHLIAPISTLISKAVDKVAPDAGEAEKLKNQITKELIHADTQAFDAQVQVLITESSGNLLQRSWRPITMLFFVGLIGAHWIGLTPDNLPEAQVMALLEIVKIGLGGYVVGRSAENVMKAYKSK